MNAMAQDVDRLSGIIRWEDPPVVATGGRPGTRSWAVVAAQLRACPGRWALIADGSDAAVAHRINRGHSWWSPRGAYEATSRLVGGRLCVWARHVAPGNMTGPMGEDGM